MFYANRIHLNLQSEKYFNEIYDSDINNLERLLSRGVKKYGIVTEVQDIRRPVTDGQAFMECWSSTLIELAVSNAGKHERVYLTPVDIHLLMSNLNISTYKELVGIKLRVVYRKVNYKKILLAVLE